MRFSIFLLIFLLVLSSLSAQETKLSKTDLAIGFLVKSKIGTLNYPAAEAALFKFFKNKNNQILIKDFQKEQTLFMKLYNADKKTLQDFFADYPAKVYLFLLIDNFYLEQVIMHGRSWNIFLSKARSSLKILDPKTLGIEFIQLENDDGRGGNQQKAVLDAIEKSFKGLLDKLEKDKYKFDSIFKKSQE